PQPYTLSLHDALPISDTSNIHIRKVDLNGTITTVAGIFGSGKLGDGLSPLEAFIGGPAELYFKPNGDLVYTDLYSNRVREILNRSEEHTSELQSRSDL